MVSASQKQKSRPPGRKRRAAGWTLLTLGLLVAGVWFASGWYAAAWTGSIASPPRDKMCFSIASGSIWIGRSENLEPVRTIYPLRSSKGWQWTAGSYTPPGSPEVDLGLFHYSMIYGTLEGWSLVIWPIPLLLWTPAALLLRSGILARRRANTNACPTCGYSLAGLASDAPCPECGKAKAEA